ncbi:hypothetical protein BMS3Bbin10_01021 [bacterium BMS3Bbin10]|nr:hypothetical protein BMS3Bbin10_01021 [bacterium BMS3Bbin10]
MTLDVFDPRIMPLGVCKTARKLFKPGFDRLQRTGVVSGLKRGIQVARQFVHAVRERIESGCRRARRQRVFETLCYIREVIIDRGGGTGRKSPLKWVGACTGTSFDVAYRRGLLSPVRGARVMDLRRERRRLFVHAVQRGG